MRKFLLGLSLLIVAVQAEAASVCYNNVCGQLICQFGCIMRSVNNVCVEKRCTGGWGHKESEHGLDDMEISEPTAYCISCANGYCYEGNSFLEAEAACKRYHAFGCFTRCN